MKRFLPILALLGLFSISAVGPLSVAEPGSDVVTFEGRVYIWTLDYARSATAAMDDFADIPYGEYRPAPNLYVEAEFGWLNRDPWGYTDDYGYFHGTKSNPWWGSYSMDIEVRAEVMLDRNTDLVNIYPAGTDLGLFYEGRLNWYPYNGQTDTVSVGAGETLTMDIYIGGPGVEGGYLITDWWDDYPSDHLIGFYAAEVIGEAYHWAVAHGIPAEDIARPTNMLYGTGDGIQYAPFTPPPGTAHINISSQDLYPNEVAAPSTIGWYWQSFRGSLTHEYGHKIMHDVYTTLPMSFQEPKCTGHGVDSTIAPECGFVEGWAEFFAAAVRNWPTINGDVGGSNIEVTYTPRALSDSLGSIAWRDMVADGQQFMNEGENAAVLWDIYDPKSWEYMLPDEQNSALIFEWPTPLRWYDRLSGMDDIWAILVEDDPDCMWDETTEYEFTNDGFWKYWRDRFSSDSAKIHGLKAILYNREILTYPLIEIGPEVHIVSVDLVNRKAQLEITESNEEDRPYLYYNLAYRQNDASSLRLVRNTDMLVSTLGGTWQGDTLTVEVALPPAEWIYELVFLVHDSMKPYFERYTVLGGDTELDGDSDTGWRELTLEDGGRASGRSSAGEMIANDGLLYVASGGVDGFSIYDIRTSPGYPALVGSFTYQDFNPPQSLAVSDIFMPFSIELEGDTLFVADTDSVNAFDVSDPTDPTLISRLVLDEPPADFTTHGLEYYKGYLYSTAGYEGLYIIHVNPDGQLELVNQLEQDDCRGATDVVAYEDTLYLLCEDAGIMIIDLTTLEPNLGQIGWAPGLPTKQTGLDYEEFLLDPENERLYIPYRNLGVYVLDISSPQAPVVETVIDASIVSSLSLQDDILYTAEFGENYGISAYDVRNIAEPVLLDHLDTITGPQILAAGEFIYVGDGVSMRLVRIMMP